jgi:3-deoxy-D-manno-octulosonic-acid transferase
VPREQLVVCGSIHADEVAGLFTALDALPEDVRMIVAPRHSKATSIIMNESRRRDWSTCLRSAVPPDGAWRVLVLDTVGELADAYARGSVAVVGGGFRRHGGHNPFEAVFQGTPVLLGPHFDHFATEAAALTSACPESSVVDFTELARQLREWLDLPARRRQALSRQQAALPNAARIADAYRVRLTPRMERQGVRAAPGKN